MSGILRIVLILMSIMTYIFISRKLRKAQINTYDTIFWIVIAGILILFSMFPWIVEESSRIIGIRSSENFVFVFIIFILLMKVFFMNIKMSHLENQIMDLVESLAIKEKLWDEREKEMKTTENNQKKDTD